MLPLDRGIVVSGYTNHVDSTKDAKSNVFAVFTQDPAGDEKARLLVRRRQQGTGVWTDVYTFHADDDTKYGYCSVECVLKNLVILASERQPDGTNPVREYILVDVCEI